MHQATHPVASPTVGAKPPTLQDATCATETNEPIGLCQVGEGRLVHCAGPRMTDAEREWAIVRAGKAVERHMQAVSAINNREPHVFSDFADAASARWMAQQHQKQMEKLIAGRSEAQIARMQAAQDERLAREPGAVRT